ncbi:unnamed protein product [Mytilus edulis]|uniref:Integrase catalytic domain-containing protein n=1 Tax=Mytilus edulis TaxID=6550 RepID=A0A8S3U6I6_MYTED|nr:unnamed protein product [Mytilus edulis]
MSTRINLPSFNKSKSYELYKQELLAWSEITDLDKKKRGIAVALSLPEDDETKIREKVFDQIVLDDLKKDTGLNTLVDFLDKHLAKDDLADSLEKFEDFEDYTRPEGQSINEYVAYFDSKYRKIEKKNMKLPSEILAFKLLRKANISKEEKMLVLTGMNYENKMTLYEEAKRSLKKFKGEGGQVKGVAQSIKLEPTFLAENEEALWAAGYVKRGNSYGYKRGGRYSRGGGRGQGFQSSQRGAKNLNPSGPDGKLLTCRSCGSYRHLVAKCPDSWENLSKVHITEEEEHAVLFTGYQKQDIKQLGNDARNCAVLDSACSSTVCGKTWLNSYLYSLNEEDREKVVNRSGHKVFKFGGGTRLKSVGEYDLPICMVGEQVKLKTDVVDSDIPLLLSRSAMKKAGVKMDLENDTAIIMGKEVSLNLTSSGHYCIPIDKTETLKVEEVNAVRLDELNVEKRKTALLKLHRQFAHPPKKRLVALLKDAGTWKEEYDEDLSEIQSKCDLCKMYAVTPPRPVVSMPMAKQFNEKVTIDLKQYKDRWILHMIDMWSRYTVSVFINRKKPTNVIEALMKNWVGIFGVMGALMSDNGGEFSSDEMREVASILNVKVCTTAGMSPYQNGLCERVHAITDIMLMKLEAENKNVESGTLLSWANMARNSLQMWNGFSSHQLVFGKNPNLPNLMHAQLPALEGTTGSEAFAKHLNTLHETRKAYIQTEADERIRRALRSKVRAAEQVYENGDMVFYKREGKERWLGPGKVVFQDGKVVFVRHGGVFVRVSPNRLCKINTDLGENKEQDNIALKKSDIIISNEIKEQTNEEKKSFDIISETITSAPQEDPSHEATAVSHNLQLIKKDDNIRYKLQGSDEWISATVLGRAGKATGGNKSWYNVKDHVSDEQKSVDLGNLEWNILEDQTNDIEVQTTDEVDQNDSDIAKQLELQKLRQFNTYEEVEDGGQKTISTRWVITNKNGETRARLVARGFEEHSFIPKDSPTIGKGSIRIFLTFAASKKWSIKTTDIKSAFLQGKKLDRDVHIKPPVESDTPKGLIWKLKHGLYGLKDGARQFYISVKDELLNLGCRQSKLDPALFILTVKGSLQGIFCCHVDDFLHAGNEEFEKLMEKLRKRFIAGKIEEENFRYIGFMIKQNNEGIQLDHSIYMEKLDHQHIEPQRAFQKLKQLTQEEQKDYRRMVGQLNWAVQGSRPDLAFELVDLSTKLKSALVCDLLRAIKNIGKLKDIRPIQLFPSLKGKETEDWEIFVFSDAALGNINDGKGSTGAHIVWIKDRIGKCCPISWQANKIKRVVRSTIAAEALSLQDGLETALYFRSIIEDICGVAQRTIPITAFIDNKSVTEALKSTKLVEDKRLRIDIASISEMIENSCVEVKWCPGKVQLANSMTKRGASGIELLNVLQKGQMPEEFV